MPEFRQDPVTERWVVVAPERALRPHAFSANAAQDRGARQDASDCPFCPGHEASCPECLLSYTLDELRVSDHPARHEEWSVRVIGNLYPAVTLDEHPGADLSTGDSEANWLVRRPGYGSHEVVIESARHLTRSHELSVEELELTLRAYQERFRAWRQIPGLRWGMVFKNDGPAAGASLEHVHSQLIALPDMPPRFQLEWDGARRWAERHHGCVFCQMIQRECQAGTRWVDNEEGVVVFCPYASRTPYEMCLLPWDHASDFDRAPTTLVSCVARRLWRTLQRLEHVVPGCDFNYLIHTSPFDTIGTDHYHWHIEIIPRLAHLAGYEWGTDLHINVTPPERAAQLLRNA